MFFILCSQLLLFIDRSIAVGYVDDSIEYDMIVTNMLGALTNYIDKK